jgi:hypothetical protein
MPIAPDVNWISYYGDNPDTDGFENPPYPKAYDDIIKFYHCTNAQLKGKTVDAGTENNVDATGCTNIEFSDCRFVGKAGISAFTIKGKTDGWRIVSCMISHGRETDVELGQFDNSWYWGRPPTRNGLIWSCESNDGGPIKVTCWDAVPPEVVDSNVKIVRVPKFIWLPYFCWRWIRHHWF